MQPNKDMISSNLSAGTLSIEFSGLGEKIFTNCGASETFGKNPEYLRYSAAHSTIILQNTNISEIKEGNPHIKFPQSVVFRKESNDDIEIFEGGVLGKLFNLNHAASSISSKSGLTSPLEYSAKYPNINWLGKGQD